MDFNVERLVDIYRSGEGYIYGVNLYSFHRSLSKFRRLTRLVLASTSAYYVIPNIPLFCKIFS